LIGWKYNLLISPVVFLVRAPLLLPLYGIARLGDAAQWLYDALDPMIPGFKVLGYKRRNKFS